MNKFFIGLLASISLFACKDDDDGIEEVPERDPGEQVLEDEEALEDYLATHFYNYEEFEDPSEDFDNVVRFDTIDESNADKTPLIESDKLITKTIERGDINYTFYVLKVREGAGEQPTFADSTFLSFRGELLNRTIFEDNTSNAVWRDLPGTIVQDDTGQLSLQGDVVTGRSQALTEFRAASDFTTNPDNTVTWEDDYGVGAVFMPSGLGYFSGGSGILPAYSPLIYSFKLYIVNRADHDGDGVPSYLEDLDGDEDLFNDDTDGNGIPNYADSDDDGDGTPTPDEINIDEDGEVELIDSNNDGTPDYLDADTFQ